MSNAFNSFLKAWSIQYRVINALILREVITRYGRNNIGFLWLFVEPIFYTLAITMIWSSSGVSRDINIPITAIAVTGFSCLNVWRNCSSRLLNAIQANHSLMYHRNVRVLDIYLARLTLEILGVTASFIVLTITFSYLGWMKMPVDIITVLEGWFLMCWFAISIGLVIGAISEFTEVIGRIWPMVAILSLPFSGAAYMLDWMPIQTHDILLWIPMLHCTEMIRHGFFGHIIKTYEDPSYVITCNLILTFIGLILLKRVGRIVAR
jgi:capsular polysaccharide transport system permease protein